MKVRNLHDLFVSELRDIYHAEKQLTRALKKMAAAASSEQLAEAFREHLQQTERQVARLEEVFATVEQKPRAKTCEAMAGLIEEAEDLVDSVSDEAACDAGLVASAQKVEHYEIATYGTLATWADQLGLSRAAQLLKETLAEEKAADQKLTTLAEGALNLRAEHAGA